MSNITINIPKGAAAIIDTLQSNGFEAYLVGGCVRDSILKRPVHDWDITTSATTDEMKKVFSDTKIIETGIKHGTLTILSVDGFYECTTYRIDGAYSDGRHPDIVRFTKSLAEDLKRRDFTINAMAYNDKEGLIDLFGGRLDLMDHVIRCVGNPEDRFKEDALRIMRALRFAAQLEFDLEMKTKIAAFQMSDTLTKVSAERINSEFCKILTQPMGSQVINNYKEIIAVFIPEIRDMFDFEQNNPYHMFNVWDHTIEVIWHYLKCFYMILVIITLYFALSFLSASHFSISLPVLLTLSCMPLGRLLTKSVFIIMFPPLLYYTKPVKRIIP